MKNFDWTELKRSIAIEAPMDVLYKAWTTAAEIENWFLSNAKYIDNGGEVRDARSEAKAGDSYKWNWFLYEPTEEGKVTEATGIDHFQFTFAGDCIVDVKFKAYDKGTIITLTQSNIPTDDKSKKDIRLGCDTGWSFYLVNLKSVYEGGIDLRNKEAGLKIMLNN